MGPRQGVDEFGVASVALGDVQVLEESGQAQVEGDVALPAGAVRRGAGEPGFTDAGGAGDEDIEVVADPLVSIPTENSPKVPTEYAPVAYKSVEPLVATFR